MDLRIKDKVYLVTGGGSGIGGGTSGNPRNFGVGSMGTETCSRTGTSMTETRS